MPDRLKWFTDYLRFRLDSNSYYDVDHNNRFRRTSEPVAVPDSDRREEQSTFLFTRPGFANFRILFIHFNGFACFFYTGVTLNK